MEKTLWALWQQGAHKQLALWRCLMWGSNLKPCLNGKCVSGSSFPSNGAVDCSEKNAVCRMPFWITQEVVRGVGRLSHGYVVWKCSHIVVRFIYCSLVLPSPFHPYVLLFGLPSMLKSLPSPLCWKHFSADCADGPNPLSGNAVGTGPVHLNRRCSSGNIQCSRHSPFRLARLYWHAQNDCPCAADRATPSVSSMQLLGPLWYGSE